VTCDGRKARQVRQIVRLGFQRSLQHLTFREGRWPPRPSIARGIHLGPSVAVRESVLALVGTFAPAGRSPPRSHSWGGMRMVRGSFHVRFWIRPPAHLRGAWPVGITAAALVGIDVERGPGATGHGRAVRAGR
jgi:hypothetical protein